MKDLIKKIWAWITSRPADKLLHDYAGELISMYSFALFLIICSFWTSAVLCNVLAILFLIGKEVYDYFKPDGHSVEMADIAYGLFGILKFDLFLIIVKIAISI